MKRLLPICFFLLTSLCFGQSPHAEEIKDLTQNLDLSQMKSIGDSLSLKPGEVIKVYVAFNINEEGEVENIRAKSRNPRLEQEAIRLVKTLPKFEPAMKNGERISVQYSLPIIFQIETEAQEKKRLRKQKRKERRDKRRAERRKD